MDTTKNQASLGHPTVDQDSTSELAADIAETARILFAAGSVTNTLAQVVALAVATIEGCDFAGLFLLDKNVITAPVNSDPAVNEIDALQHDTGEGPCLDAVAHRLVFYADDVADD